MTFPTGITSPKVGGGNALQDEEEKVDNGIGLQNGEDGVDDIHVDLDDRDAENHY